MAQLISIKDTRDRLADIVNEVAFGDSTFIITKFGEPKAMIVPFSKSKANNSAIEETFGAWAKRDDIKDSGKWVENLRAKMSVRQ